MEFKKLFLLAGLIISFLSVSSFFSSCTDDNNNGKKPDIDDPFKPDLGTKVKTTVHGFITDEEGEPIEGANITANDKVATSDNFGYFEIPNVDLVKDAAFVKVKKAGYFDGGRTWQATEEAEQLVRIKLLPKTIAGSVSAAEGGAVTSSQGVKLSFPKDAVVTSIGEAYTGRVNIAVQWLDPADQETAVAMPGNFTTYDTKGELIGTANYGIGAIELLDDSGNLLQVAPDKEIKVTVPISADLLANAPDKISTSSFDETRGVWTEEGVADKVGNEYVGNLRHFSWWQWTLPLGTRKYGVTCRFVDEDGNPVKNLWVKIRSRENGYCGYDMTDNQGRVTGGVPGDSYYTMDVTSSISKYMIVMELKFEVKKDRLDMGTHVIPGPKKIRIEGKILNCDGTPATGKAFIQLAGFKEGYDIHSIFTTLDGKFGLNFYTQEAQKINFFLSSIALHQYQLTVPIGTHVIGIPPFVNECRDAIIKGTLKTCEKEHKDYNDGGYAVFVSEHRSIQSFIVNNSYTLKYQIPYDHPNEKGTLTIYDRGGNAKHRTEVWSKLGEYNVPEFNAITPIKVSGTVVDCNNKPVVSGTIEMVSQYYNTTVPIVNGVYNFELKEPESCQDEDITLIVIDDETLTMQETQTKISLGNNTIPLITVCDPSGMQMTNHIIVNYEGKTYKLRRSMHGYAALDENIIELVSAEDHYSDRAMVLRWNTSSVTTGTFNINDTSIYTSS